MEIKNFNFKGLRTFVRVDFNVPVDENHNITDDTRIQAAMPTLKKIIADGGRLIIASHMGRPKKNPDPNFSLKYILPHVSEVLGIDVKWADDCAKADDVVASLKDGEAVLLENLRFYAEEEGKPRGIDKEDPAYDAAKKEMKAAQKEFAKKLASYADVYVNDAFGTAHRKHASTAVIADSFDKDHKMFGFLMEKEVVAVDKVLRSTEKPVTAIIGGSKVSSKITIIENLLTKVDNLVIIGGMAYTFSLAKGGKVGKSLCEPDFVETAKAVMAKAKELGVNLLLPTDCIAADDFNNDANTQVVDNSNVPDGWEGMDIGPKSAEAMAKVIETSKVILWNGPAGVFEMANFQAGTKAIATAVAKATRENGAFSLIGGGDSVSAIKQFGFADQVSYVSTGGGALLEAIEGKVLPGIAAIQD